jgi:hypothetical protein
MNKLIRRVMNYEDIKINLKIHYKNEKKIIPQFNYRNDMIKNRHF